MIPVIVNVSRQDEGETVVPLAGRWSYLVRRSIDTAVAADAEQRSGLVMVPGVHYRAATHLLRDGKPYGALHRDIVTSTCEERERSVATRIENARKRKAQS